MKHRLRIPILDDDTLRPFTLRLRDESGISAIADESAAEILIKSGSVSLARESLRREAEILLRVSSSRLALSRDSVEIVIKAEPSGFRGQLDLLLESGE